MLGLAATSRWEASLVRGRICTDRLTVRILCKLYVLYTHIYGLCPQGCKDNLSEVDGIMQVVFLSLQMLPKQQKNEKPRPLVLLQQLQTMSVVCCCWGSPN